MPHPGSADIPAGRAAMGDRGPGGKPAACPRGWKNPLSPLDLPPPVGPKFGMVFRGPGGFSRLTPGIAPMVGWE